MRLNSLTALRFVAALGVFGLHAARHVGPLRHVVRQGGVGVTFFFVLSGFVLMWVHDDKIRGRSFYRRRFARIWPAFFAAWIAAAAIGVLQHDGTHSVGRFIVGGLLLQSWLPDRSWYFAVNGVSWTLSVEAFFYFTFPFWAGRLAGASRRQLRVLAAVALIAFFVIAVLVHSNAAGSWVRPHFPPVRIFEFFLGACVALEVRRRTMPRVPFGAAVALAAAAYLFAGSGEAHRFLGARAITLVPFALLLAAAAQADLRGGTVLGNRGLVWLGEISYCFYLVHFLVIEVVAPHVTATAVRLPLELALAVLAAAALHHLIEVPLERRLRGARPRVELAPTPTPAPAVVPA
jgi:peptidoglycan/LPS O-acetylase OafA/YrhL